MGRSASVAELPKWARALLETSRVGRLGLVDRYEQYRDRPPAGPVIELAPDRIVWWKA
jgi:hypothetical protein